MPFDNKMQAIHISESGGPEVLELRDFDIPLPLDDEILIKVAAAGVNRADCVQRAGFYVPPLDASPILGLEVAGEIVAMGEAVKGWEIGDKVIALTNGGGYANYAVATAMHSLPLPENLSMVEGSALIEAVLTVYSNLFSGVTEVKKGERVLVHGGSSGIGVIAIQMLAEILRAEVVVTAGNDKKCAACVGLGAALAVNYKENDFESEIQKFYGDNDKKGCIDVVLDMVGGDYIKKNMSLLRKDGRHVNIAFLNGAKSEILVPQLMMKRLILTGTTLRHRTKAEKTAYFEKIRERVWSNVEKSVIKPVIDKKFALKNACDAHRYMEKSQHIGKIILTM